MWRMFPTVRTILFKLNPIGVFALVLGTGVVAAFTFTAGEADFITRHFNTSPEFGVLAALRGASRYNRKTTICSSRPSPREDPLLYHSLATMGYSIISVITPAPTVRPPSRMAKRRPFSIAIGVINSTLSRTLSPGMTISVPSGSVATPVTSVVRK